MTSSITSLHPLCQGGKLQAQIALPVETSTIDDYCKQLREFLKAPFKLCKSNPDFVRLIEAKTAEEKKLQGTILQAFCSIMEDKTTVAITPFAYMKYQTMVKGFLESNYHTQFPSHLLNSFVPPPFSFSRIELLQFFVSHPMIAKYKLDVISYGSVLFSILHPKMPFQHNDVDILVVVQLDEKTRQNGRDFLQDFSIVLSEFFSDHCFFAIKESLAKLLTQMNVTYDAASVLEALFKKDKAVLHGLFFQKRLFLEDKMELPGRGGAWGITWGVIYTWLQSPCRSPL